MAAAAAGYAIANAMSRKSAGSRAHLILEEARKDAEVIKDKKILEAKEQEVKILADAERNANSKLQKAQASEARAKQREMQLNQQQNELNRRKKNSTSRNRALTHA